MSARVAGGRPSPRITGGGDTPSAEQRRVSRSTDGPSSAGRPEDASTSPSHAGACTVPHACPIGEPARSHPPPTSAASVSAATSSPSTRTEETPRHPSVVPRETSPAEGPHMHAPGRSRSTNDPSSTSSAVDAEPAATNLPTPAPRTNARHTAAPDTTARPHDRRTPGRSRARTNGTQPHEHADVQTHRRTDAQTHGRDRPTRHGPHLHPRLSVPGQVGPRARTASRPPPAAAPHRGRPARRRLPGTRRVPSREVPAEVTDRRPVSSRRS